MRTDLTKPYNQTDNPVDVNGADFLCVMAYFKKQGLPMPEVVSEVVTRPEQPPIPGVPARWTNILLIWDDPQLRPDPFIASAYLAMTSPATTVVDYLTWRGHLLPPRPPEYAPEPPPPVAPMPYVWGQHENQGKAGYVRRVIQTPFGPRVDWVKE
jgi:hypothetical protein